MATYTFSSLIGTTITGFNVDSDVLAILNSGPEVTISTSGSNTVVTTAAGSVTLANISVAQLTATNITINGGTVGVGDGTSSTALDVAGNTISVGSGGNLVYGLGGGDSITVGNGNNLIFGGSGVADSSDGGDTIVLGSGTNILYANAGNDVITFTAGAGTTTGKVSTAYLGAGDDSYTSSTSLGNHVLTGGAGNDTINMTNHTGDVTVYGGTGIVDTTDGNETLTLGTGNALVYTNVGTDAVTLGATASGKTATIYLGGGNDSVTSAAAAGSIVIYGGGDSDNISTNSVTGDVTIFGGTGTVDTTDGADTIVAGAAAGGNSTVYGNAGADNITVSAIAGKVGTIYGGAGGDTITLTAGAVSGTTIASFLVAGGDGSDTIAAAFTNVGDVIVSDFGSGDVFQVTLNSGAAVNLNVSGTDSTVTIFNDSGANGYTAGTDERITLNTTQNLSATNFVISGGTRLLTNFSSTATTLTGGAAADQIVSGSAADTIVGGGAADKLIGGGGADVFQFTAALAGAFDSTAVTITGGDGSDTLEISDTNAATMAANDFTATITGMEILKLSNASHNITTGTAFATAGFTTINADALSGTNTLAVTGGTATAGFMVDADGATSTGVMTITTGTGNDTILSGAGADAITLSTGNDSVNSGSGNDTITVAIASLTSADSINGGAGTDNITLSDISTGGDAIADSDFTNISNLEQLILANGAGAQTVTVGTAAGTAGLVLINGSAESGHALTIDASSMTTGIAILGGDTGDSMTGGSGNDTLSGGGGTTVDTLVGGSGADHYAAATAANGVDIIASSNFVVGASGDVFDFDYNNFTTFTNLVGENILTTTAAAATIAGFGTTIGALVSTTDAVGNAAAIDTALEGTDLDTATFGTRIVVWEIDANTVGVGSFLNGDNGATTNDITVTQLFSITGFANQAAVDAFTSGLVAANFDFI